MDDDPSVGGGAVGKAGDTGIPPMDEATIRAALARLTDDRGVLLVPNEAVTGVVVEGDWVAVVLNPEQVPQDVLPRVHRHLAAAFPGAAIEARLADRVHRGGAGFGIGRHVVAVLGGKGGVGKSTVAINLALTLSAMGAKVGLLDGDLNAPDIPHMLGVHPRERPSGVGWDLWKTDVTPPSRWRRPYARFGLEVMSTGFVIAEDQPPLMTSRLMVSALLRHLIFEVAWRGDILLLDAPPGTGDELQVMVRELPLSGAIFVTTPQDLAQMDAERTLTLLSEHGVPVIGMVQNMASLQCPHCQGEIDMFAQSSRLADTGVPVLGRIPFDTRLSEGADRGEPLVLGDVRGLVAGEFARIGHLVRRWLANRDAVEGR